MAQAACCLSRHTPRVFCISWAFPCQSALARLPETTLQGKPAVQLTARCGKCKACLRPTLRKPCLSPVTRSEEEALAAAAENAK